MKVFVAGGSGAVGRRLLPALVARGYDVVAMTRSTEKASLLRTLGAHVVVADALDRDAVAAALLKVQPEVVIHQLTGLAGLKSFKKFDTEFALTNRLRTEGTDLLLEAALAAGARRFIAQSYGNWNYERTGTTPKIETDSLDPRPPANQVKSLQAIRHLENAVVEADGIEGVALRYANFYGPGTGFALDGEIAKQVRKRQFPLVGDGGGVWSFVHMDDAAIAAIEHGTPGVYNIADDQPVSVAEWLPAFAEAVGAKPPRHVPVWLGRFGGRRGRRIDDDPDPRRLERQGQARALLGAALPKLPTRFPARTR